MKPVEHITLSSAKAGWKCPSNIALVKYWGKKSGLQLPANASISFTLSNCHTSTYITAEPKTDQENFSFEFWFDGAPKPSFEPKIETFFTNIVAYLPWLKQVHLKIESSNSFPHSSGIASSASSFGALALCLMDIQQQWVGGSVEEVMSDVSFLARIGSGSACRSVFGPLAVWGEHSAFTGSSDEYAVEFSDVHPVFKRFKDTVLIVEAGSKSVSSTAGHGLMIGHPYAEARFVQAEKNLSDLKSAMQSGDLDSFYEIVEAEAFALHAMMITGQPAYMLFKPETIRLIELIRDARKTKGVSCCFTLDAGANVHLLYPSDSEHSVMELVKNEWAAYCENGRYICDEIQNGPTRI